MNKTELIEGNTPMPITERPAPTAPAKPTTSKPR